MPRARRSGAPPPRRGSRAGARAPRRRSSGCPSARTYVRTRVGRTGRAWGEQLRRRARAREQRLLPGQRLARGRVDPHRHDLARRGEPGEVYRLVVARAAAYPRRVGARRALDEHVERPADEPLRALVRAPLHDLDEALHPLDLHLVRHDALGDLGRVRPAARRVDEREGAVVADLLADLERLREVLLGLAREADDDVGRQRAVGDVLADQRDAVEVAPAVVRPAHRLEDPRRARLQRQVDVLAERRQLGVRADDVLAHVLRVRARVADAVDAVDRVDQGQQLREGRLRALGQVAPVGVHVLPQERDLADAVGGQPLDLLDQLAGRAAHLAPARRRDDAVRAAAVAANRDLDPALVLALALRRQVAGEGLELEEALRREAVARQELGQLRHLAGSERDVHERELLEHLVLHGLCPAAAHADHPLRILGLQPLGLAQMADQPVVRLLADGAGVEEDQVGLVALAGLLVAERLEHALHALRVVLVHLAAERRDVVALHGREG